MKQKITTIIDKRDNTPTLLDLNPKSEHYQGSLEAIADYLISILPHGSGINGLWCIDYNPRNKKIYCSNSYHAMDENGYYSGWYDFTVSYKLHDSNEKHTCKYCNESGIRFVSDIAKYHRDNLEFTLQLLQSHNDTILYNDSNNPYLICNFCFGKGFTTPKTFEMLNVNYHGGKKYLERVSYGVTDYLEELLYNPEESLEWLNEQKAKMTV